MKAILLLSLLVFCLSQDIESPQTFKNPLNLYDSFLMQNSGLALGFQEISYSKDFNNLKHSSRAVGAWYNSNQLNAEAYYLNQDISILDTKNFGLNLSHYSGKGLIVKLGYHHNKQSTSLSNNHLNSEGKDIFAKVLIRPDKELDSKQILGAGLVHPFFGLSESDYLVNISYQHSKNMISPYSFEKIFDKINHLNLNSAYRIDDFVIGLDFLFNQNKSSYEINNIVLMPNISYFTNDDKSYLVNLSARYHDFENKKSPKSNDNRLENISVSFVGFDSFHPFTYKEVFRSELPFYTLPDKTNIQSSKISYFPDILKNRADMINLETYYMAALNKNISYKLNLYNQFFIEQGDVNIDDIHHFSGKLAFTYLSNNKTTATAGQMQLSPYLYKQGTFGSELSFSYGDAVGMPLSIALGHQPFKEVPIFPLNIEVYQKYLKHKSIDLKFMYSLVNNTSLLAGVNFSEGLLRFYNDDFSKNDNAISYEAGLSGLFMDKLVYELKYSISDVHINSKDKNFRFNNTVNLNLALSL